MTNKIYRCKYIKTYSKTEYSNHSTKNNVSHLIVIILYIIILHNTATKYLVTLY